MGTFSFTAYFNSGPSTTEIDRKKYVVILPKKKKTKPTKPEIFGLVNILIQLYSMY